MRQLPSLLTRRVGKRNLPLTNYQAMTGIFSRLSRTCALSSPCLSLPLLGFQSNYFFCAWVPRVAPIFWLIESCRKWEERRNEAAFVLSPSRIRLRFTYAYVRIGYRCIRIISLKWMATIDFVHSSLIPRTKHLLDADGAVRTNWSKGMILHR